MSKKCDDGRKVIMWEIEVQADQATFDKVIAMGLEWIKDDKSALFNYAANRILEEQLIKGKRASKKK
jgi:hypothetical protein